MKIKPEIEVLTHKVEGYGGPSEYVGQLIYKNVLLESGRSASEMALGEFLAKVKAYWCVEWVEQEFLSAIKGKPAASQLCDHCGGNTIRGSTLCVDKTFCSTCNESGIIESYIKAYQARCELNLAEAKKVAEAETERQRLSTAAQVQGAFHWRDGWFFKRSQDGSVRVMHKKDYLRTDLTIPANEWASIVCSVTTAGETGERWEQAREFHNRPLLTSLEGKTE